MKNNVLTSNLKYCQATCDGNGDSRTYDHCYLSHELHKDEKIFLQILISSKTIHYEHQAVNKIELMLLCSKLV